MCLEISGIVLTILGGSDRFCTSGGLKSDLTQRAQHAGTLKLVKIYFRFAEDLRCI
jgi:hypothetical protein